MDVAVGYQAAGIARLDRAEPQRRMRRLRRQDVGDVGPLKILVVQGARIERGVPARFIRSIDI
jgi:hypothetical protein